MDLRSWPSRLCALDVSRGIASLAVILWHWQHFAFNGDAPPANLDRTSQPFYGVLKIFYENGTEGVTYFFLLSGFIFFWVYMTSIGNRSTGFRTFWVQRFSRLYPLHFMTLLIVALLQTLYTWQKGSPFIYRFNDTYHFVLNLGLASGWGFEEGFSFNGPVWSVSIEVLLYLLFFIVVFRRLGQMFICYCISLVAFLLSLLFSHDLFSGLALFFAGGFVFHLTHQIASKQPRLRRTVYAVAVLSWSLTIVNYYVLDLSALVLRLGLPGFLLLRAFPGYMLFPATICSLALLEINRGNILKSYSWIGDITYSSYLLHFPLQLIFALLVIFGLLKPDFYLAPLALIVFFFILIPVSYLTYRNFERPVQNSIRNRYVKLARSRQNDTGRDESRNMV
jgi:peptidoglycan/LPS O-acetylase OafA/YrhL